MSEIPTLPMDDVNHIREIGSRIIRNLSLFMDNPFSYAHLIDICESDLNSLQKICEQNHLQGDGLLPAQPLGVATQPQDIPTLLIDAGFARLRELVDTAMHAPKEEVDSNE